MATDRTSAERTEFFKQLKATCIPLSQLVIREQDASPDAKEILRHLDSLSSSWSAQVSKNATILDEKLAGYVFFPVSYILRKQDKYPVLVLETVIRLLESLVQHGWKAKIPSDLFQQLLRFLSLFIGDASEQTKRRDLPEETILEVYRTLTALIVTTGRSLALPTSPQLDDQIIPSLGSSVVAVLGGITVGVPALIQLEALRYLQAVFTEIHDSALLAQFLPGTVSCLSKILSPPQQQKTQRRVLIKSLEVLKVVLTASIGDIKVRGILKQMESASEMEESSAAAADEDTKLRIELTPSWLKATTSQVKIALTGVLKLRNHEAEDIQAAVRRLCISLLDQCHASLVTCQSILVETAMMLEEEENMRSTLETSLQDLVTIYPELVESVKSSLYNWVTGLPRVMQSNDERVKQLAVRNILRGSKHASSLQLDASNLDDYLGDALRDSVVALVKGSKPPKIASSDETDMVPAAASGLDKAHMGLEAYRPVLLEQQGQKTTRAELMTLISNVGTPTQQVKLAASMLGYVRDSNGVDQVASYWLAFELLKSSYTRSSALDELLDLSSLDETRGQEEAFQELYDFSTSVLSSHSDSVDSDWRIEAIALEVSAFAASRLKTGFRIELVDVLYPVVTFLGSPTPQLRSHAITTLAIIAASCGYGSVSELIVDNADYMVNSISLRLNEFDISPASTRVLTMLIRLTGPRLIPYLDDVIAVIFTALDNYHGYPVLVQSLFSVLSEVVSQGVQSNTLLLEDSNAKPVDHRKRRPVRQGIQRILDSLDKRAERERRREEEEKKDDEIKGHPTKPWGPEKSEAKSLLDKLENPEDEVEEESGAAVEVEKSKPPTQTYALLSQILSLTQHYLTSPTPTLRKSLLDLVGTVSPALARDENAFLPLVNAVWPVIITRLQDPEPFVAIAACKALSSLCSAAGDFLSTRFKTEWSSGLAKWFSRTKAEAVKARGKAGTGKAAAVARSLNQTSGLLGSSVSSDILIPGRPTASEESRGLVIRSPQVKMNDMMLSSSSGLGRFAQASQIWDAAVELLGAIVMYVRVDDDMFDEMLELVADVIPRNEALREAFEVINADAVWLVLYEQGLVPWKPEPVLEGFRFAPMRALG